MMLVYKVSSVPDLTLSKYEVFADSGIEGMVEAQTQFLRQLYRAALLGGVSLHYIFDYDPNRSEGQKIEIRLLFCGEGQEQTYFDKLRKLVKSSGISDYFKFTELTELVPPEEPFSYMCMMRKKERFLQTVVDGEETFFYVVPNWKLKDDCRLYSIFKMMEAFDEPCCYRVDLYTESDLEEQIHRSFERPLTFLRNTSKQDRGISEYSRVHSEKKDPNADEVLRQYEDWLKAVDTSPNFLCRICSFSKDAEYAQLLVDSTISECLETGNGTLLVRKGVFTGIEELSIVPARQDSCDKDAPNSMQRWPITFSLNEAAAFCRLPVLYDGENIEIPKETTASHSTVGIKLGNDGHNYPVRIPLTMLSKHMFVCGVPGSGKTNTMLHIANSLWNYQVVSQNGQIEKAHIPFLVLEPAKREYRELALFDIPELILFSPSACTDFPLALNPFEFPVGLTLSEHIGRLCQVFEGAFPISGPSPFILDRAIQSIYEKRGWDVRSINTGDKPYPTMSELYDQFASELAVTTYDGELKGNIRSVLEVRIGSFLRREMKDIFDVPKSTISPEEWLTHPVVIELEALGEGPANFVTLLLCTLIRETLKVNPMQDRAKPTRHVIFIEEAHNLIAAESQSERPEDSNPKIAATAFIVKMLAEVRALREGIIIADQLPTAMAPEVIKNTNIKLVHRLTSQDDRQLVGSTMSASPLQLENMATYTKGHALFTFEDLLRPFDMQVSLVPIHGEDTPNDQRLSELMTDEKLHPVYVGLRKRLEWSKWESLKQSIQALSRKCRFLINQLADVSFDDCTNATVEKYIETVLTNCTNLENEKNLLTTQIMNLDDRFIPHETKDNSLEVVAGLGLSYRKLLENKLRAWSTKV